MPGKRKSYTPEFKFKVVMESFQQNGPQVFTDKRNPKTRAQMQGYAPGESPDELKRLIGDLAVQNDLLKKSRGLLG